MDLSQHMRGDGGSQSLPPAIALGPFDTPQDIIQGRKRMYRGGKTEHN